MCTTRKLIIYVSGFCKSWNAKHFRLSLVSVYSIQSREHLLFQQLLSWCQGKGTLLAAVPGSNTYNLQILGKSLNRVRQKNRSAWFKHHLHFKLFTMCKWCMCKFSLLCMEKWKICAGICLPFVYTSVWICNCEEVGASPVSPSTCEMGGLIMFLSSCC